MKSNYLNLVGLANRARKITIGEELIIKDIHAGKVTLLLISDDVCNQKKKKLQDKCTTYQVSYMEVDDRYTLGHAIGKSERVAIAILDNGFAKKIRTLLS